MKEYIEREAAKNAIYEYILNQKVSMYPTSEICKAARGGAEGAMYEIEYVPAADVVERVRGEWIGKPIAGYTTVKCSACGSAFSANTGRWKFCPNCGADMRGKNNV